MFCRRKKKLPENVRFLDDKDEHMNLELRYIHLLKPGRLYFQYIQYTQLQLDGWSGERLAYAMADLGLIKLVWIQHKDAFERAEGKPELFYYEHTGKSLTKEQHHDLVEQLTKKTA
jgi:hypothetical protein